MPKKLSPESLKIHSLESIAQNFEILCYGLSRGSKELASLINSDEYKNVLSPFLEYPSSILEEISAHIYRRRSGAKYFLNQIIQPQLIAFEIFLCGSVHVAINLLSDRCKGLKSLTFRENVNLPTHYFTVFFRNFKNLTYLDVSGSIIDDNGFESITKYSPVIRELYASRTYLTDVGLHYMSTPKEDSEEDLRCQHLKVLEIQYNRVSPEAVALFLELHPEIESIIYEDSFAIFRCINMRVNLISLSCTSDIISSEEFAKALRCCPRLREVCISKSGACILNNKDLSLLKDMKNLTELHIGCFESINPNLNFNEGVTSAIENLGQTLKKLVLENFSEVDIDIIGRYLPNIEYLSLSEFLSLKISEEDPKNFTNLMKLEIWNIHDIRINPDVFSRFSASPLVRILFKRIDSLTDDALIPIIEGSSSLANVVLEECENLTVQTIYSFLEEPNDLTILRCWGCRGITETQSAEIKKLVKEENLDLYWDWYPYLPRTEIIESEEDDDDEEEEEAEE